MPTYGSTKRVGGPRGCPKRSYRNMKKILALVCSLILLVSGVAVYAGCSVDDDTIVVGVTNYPPMDYPDESGEWIGFDAELAEKAFGELGYEVEFKEIVWEKAKFRFHVRIAICHIGKILREYKNHKKTDQANQNQRDQDIPLADCICCLSYHSFSLKDAA